MYYKNYNTYKIAGKRPSLKAIQWFYKYEYQTEARPNLNNI